MIRNYPVLLLSKTGLSPIILKFFGAIVRLIEFDGIQHYSDRSGVWNREDSLERRQERDNRKNKWAFENNIPLVRIPYWERDKITLEMILGSTYEVQEVD